MMLMNCWLETSMCQQYYFFTSVLQTISPKLTERVTCKSIYINNLNTTRLFAITRGCRSWTIFYLSSSFLFCKYRLYLQNKSDWSNHKKKPNI